MTTIEIDYGAFPPCTTLRITTHKAQSRVHLCSECFTPINIGERYYCTVYKSNDDGKISQYKVHETCPYMEDWS